MSRRASLILSLLLLLALCVPYFSGSTVLASTAKIETTSVEVLVDGTHRITVNISLKGNLSNVQVLQSQWARGLNVAAGGNFFPVDRVSMSDNNQMMQFVFVDSDKNYDFDLGYTVHFIIQFPNLYEEYINVETIHIPRITILSTEYDNLTGLTRIVFRCRNGGVFTLSDLNEYNATSGLYDGTMSGVLVAGQEYAFRVSEPDHYLMRVVFAHATGEYTYNRIVQVNNDPPRATHVVIAVDEIDPGAVISGQYTYEDAEGDLEGLSVFTWFRYDPEGEVYSVISEATGNEYELASDDQHEYIVFQVTPVALTGTRIGAPVRSMPLFIQFDYPTAEGLAIVGMQDDGIPRRGDFVTGIYTYSDPRERPETESEYRWYYYEAGEYVRISGAEHPVYLVGTVDLGRQLVFAVVPKNASVTGEEARSAPTALVADCIPTAEDDEVWTDWETDISGQVQASGAYAGDVLSFQLTVPAEHGTAEVDVHGYWQYRPVTGYTGTDRFVVEVRNFYNEPALAEIRVHVETPPPPIAEGLAIVGMQDDGIPRRGDFVTGIYTYSDPRERPETESEYRWYYYEAGEYVRISGAEHPVYLVGTVDLGRQLVFAVVPKNASVTGEEARSAPTALVADCIPTAEDDEVWTDWETDISGRVQASGAYAGDVLSFQLTVPAEHGTAEVDVHGYWQYRPVTGYTGADRFVVEVRNFYNEPALAEIRVHVETPPPPIAEGLAIVGMQDDGIPRRGDFVTGIYTYSDPRERPETESEYRWYYYEAGEYVRISGAEHPVYLVGTVDLGRQLVFAVVPKNASVTGEEARSAPTAPVADCIPTAEDDEVWTDWETDISGQVQASGAYAGDVLSFQLTVPAEHGTAEVDVHGYWQYRPVTGYTGADRFVVEVHNSYGETALAEIRVHVETPPPPIAEGLAIVGMQDDGIPRRGDFVTGIYTYSDPRERPETESEYRWYYYEAGEYVRISGAEHPVYLVGTVDLGRQLVFAVVPKNASVTGEEARSAPTALVADCIPTAEDDEVWTDWETDISGRVQASGAYAGDVLSFQLTVPAEHGTAEVDVHGYWQYRPVTGYTGTDRFVVEVRNFYNEPALAEIRVHVETPPPPIAEGLAIVGMQDDGIPRRGDFVTGIYTYSDPRERPETESEYRWYYYEAGEYVRISGAEHPVYLVGHGGSGPTACVCSCPEKCFSDRRRSKECTDSAGGRLYSDSRR
jgi:hypothetical protein